MPWSWKKICWSSHCLYIAVSMTFTWPLVRDQSNRDHLNCFITSLFWLQSVYWLQLHGVRILLWRKHGSGPDDWVHLPAGPRQKWRRPRVCHSTAFHAHTKTHTNPSGINKPLLRNKKSQVTNTSVLVRVCKNGFVISRFLWILNHIRDKATGIP